MKYHGNVIEKYLHENYQIRVDIDEHGWEGVLLYHEEIEDDVIPKKYLKKLIDPLLFHMTTYEDGHGNEWLFALATVPNDVNQLLYATCFKNNEQFTGWIPKK